MAVLLAMDREAYRRSIFLDDRIVPAREQPDFVPLMSLAPATPAATTGWIFHVAHCGSTLLARALDRPDGGLVLREPFALRQLGVAPETGPDWQARVRLAAWMLARRYDDRPTIIKANVPVNFMIPALVAAAAPMIFLYFPLGDYLAAVLRSDGHRAWVRRITTEMAPAITAWAGPIPDADGDRAAVLWLAQLRAFAAALSQFRNARSLDAETLFATPALVISAAAALFEQPMASDAAAAIADSPLFATYAKNPAAAFDNDDRRARQAAARATLAATIADAAVLVGSRLECWPLPERLDRPLLGGRSRPLLG